VFFLFFSSHYLLLLAETPTRPFSLGFSIRSFYEKKYPHLAVTIITALSNHTPSTDNSSLVCGGTGVPQRSQTARSSSSLTDGYSSTELLRPVGPAGTGPHSGARRYTGAAGGGAGGGATCSVFEHIAHLVTSICSLLVKRTEGRGSVPEGGRGKVRFVLILSHLISCI
jgi:hypothetical protein